MAPQADVVLVSREGQDRRSTDRSGSGIEQPVWSWNKMYPEDSLRFLVLADWGGLPYPPYNTPIEVSVSKVMANIATSFKSEFILALGDNFYYTGVKDEHDSRFKETFENVYTAESLNIPWYLVGGNHDHYGNISGQVAYTNISPRWNFPSLFYTLTFNIPNSNSSILTLMIDTVTLCGNTDMFTVGAAPEGPEDYLAAEEQWAWIEQKLQSSEKFEYVIVAGHFPVWSVAEHGPTECLVTRLRPLLNKYRVNAYFSGHDHNLQYLKEDNSTVKYFVIGSGNFVDPSVAHMDNVPTNSLKFHYSEPVGGFAYITATSKNLTLTFADGYQGKDIYQNVILPRSQLFP
ncbi:tartrate-resistant acid phosphatase type 5-like [Anneissia japonica]|uniref:tartrate-resistant acid phosphatase type 5-like n=1 Tax=Anneissia japonica TaxID=1529436 RepID=UPI0014254CDD|nr:tartrate-resistant acid phosphatase type 5-like [Anneissia japonica]